MALAVGTAAPPSWRSTKEHGKKLTLMRRPHSRCSVALRPSTSLLLVSFGLLGCPSEVEHRLGDPKPQTPAVTDESDPRVVRDGDDLYPASTKERAEQKDRPDETPPGVGSGRSDESNGVCRLFAPKLPEPECCKGEYGFDAEKAEEACGLDLYLGESFHFTCGYYFHRDAGHTWFRASFLPFDDVEEAVEAHDKKLQNLLRDEGFESTPVPGVPGAFWSRHDAKGLNWAFLPGWQKVRQVAWEDDACSREGAAKVLQAMMAAKEPPPDAPRLALVPKARG